MLTQFKLNPQLAADTHLLLDSKTLVILLHKNASIPWIVLVPKTDKTEIFDLSEIEQTAEFFKQNFATEKMNIAAIGNIVSQLHISVLIYNQPLIT